MLENFGKPATAFGVGTPAYQVGLAVTLVLAMHSLKAVEWGGEMHEYAIALMIAESF